MDAKPSAAPRRTYEDFEPSSYWNREEESDTFLLHIPGFQKNQLRVQLDGSGNVRITGERRLGDDKWSRFHKEIHVPDNCNMNEVRARFDSGTLFLIMPKTITQVATEPQTPAKQESPASDKPQTTPKQEPPINNKAQAIPKDPTSDKFQTTPKETKSKSDKSDTRRETPSTRNGKGRETINNKQPTEKMAWKEKDKKNGSAVTGRVAADEMVKEEEKKKSEPFDKGGIQDGSETDKAPESSMMDIDKKQGGRGMVVGFAKPRQLVLNVVVSVMVLVALGIYVVQKFMSSRKEAE